MKQRLNKLWKWFTLVELIVVVSIIAIVSAIAAIWVSWWLSSSRDSARLWSLNVIMSALEMHIYKSATYPMPDNYVTITESGQIVSYQWVFCDTWVNIVWSIKSIPKDPLDKECFVYSVNWAGTKYQLMTFLENKMDEGWMVSVVNRIYAADYSKRYPIVKWDKIGIILTQTNEPVNKVATGSVEII